MVKVYMMHVDGSIPARLDKCHNKYLLTFSSRRSSSKAKKPIGALALLPIISVWGGVGISVSSKSLN